MSLFYFRRDVWELGRLNLPRHRVNYKILKLNFAKIPNKYNKKALKKFVGSKIRTTSLTIEGIYGKLRRILQFLCWLKDMDIDKLTYENADDYSLFLTDSNLADKEYNEHISVLREFLEYLAMHNYQVENFFEQIDYRSVEKSQKIKEIDNDSIFLILSKLDQLSLKMKVIFFILYAGMSISHTLSLEYNCLEKENDIYKLKFYNTSFLDYDYIVIPKNLYLLIQQYIQTELDVTGVASNYLFPYSEDLDRPERYATVKNEIRNLVTGQDGKSTFQLSDLRRNLLFRLFALGIPLKIIQAVLKFKSLSILYEYLDRVNKDNLHAIAKSMNENDIAS